MNDQKKFKKKKEREKRVREKMLRRRETLTKMSKEAKERRAWEDRMEKESRVQPQPIRKKLTADEVREKLEHNMKILKALEEEYDREHSKEKRLPDHIEQDVKRIKGKFEEADSVNQG
jgi:hypothetical protein